MYGKRIEVKIAAARPSLSVRAKMQLNYQKEQQIMDSTKNCPQKYITRPYRSNYNL